MMDLCPCWGKEIRKETVSEDWCDLCVCEGDGGCWTVTNSILNLRKTITLSQRPVFGVKCDKLGVSPVAQW